jgi:dTDP-4-dehydrorhamnose reductase
MKILVTGARGMLAQALVPELRGHGHEVVALDREALDVTDEGAVHRRIGAEAPAAVVQCAAYTAVDAAENDEPAAFRLNAEATRYVAGACQRIGARLVYPSTDYVFPGDGDRPYRPADATDPINAYGRSKLAGEQAALSASGAMVVRTSWLYGAGGPNFVDTIRRLAGERESLDVVDDQIGRPTWTVDLAWAIRELLETDAAGIFHATAAGEPVSWYGVARQVVDRFAPAVELRAVASAAFPRPARRPRYSVLDCTATEHAIKKSLPEWKASLARYLDSSSGGI